MCSIFLAYQAHPEYVLLLAANRDEYYKRPTEKAAFWKEYPHVLAGRDAKQGGTWLGVARTGRFAALTNLREPKSARSNVRSRGLLVGDYLCGDLSPQQYLDAMATVPHQYNGFNLLLGERDDLYYYANMGSKKKKLTPGIYGLSNSLLDVPWPKVEKGKRFLRDYLKGQEVGHHLPLLDFLRDDSPVADHLLPDTGVGEEWERILSPVFIRSAHYGTRSSTVVMINGQGRVSLWERSFFPHSEKWEDEAFSFNFE